MRIVEYKKSEIEIEQAKESFYPAKWWQARDAEGKLLAETSVRSDFEQLNLTGEQAQKDGVTFYRLYEKKEMKWVKEHPFPETVEWRTVAGFPKYETTKNGDIRKIETHERPQPVFIGDEGHIGYLLFRGLGMHLKGMNEIFGETFPELVEEDETESEETV